MKKIALYSQGVLFIVMVLAVGVISLKAGGDYQVDDKADWTAGGQASIYEKHYDKALPIRDTGIEIWAAIEYLLFNEGRSGVVIGKQDWLFTQEEFRSYTAQTDKTTDNLRFIESVSAQLKAQGVELLVAVVPAKARVYSEYLAGQQPSVQSQARYRDLNAWLKEQSIPRVDLLGPLVAAKAERPTYLRTDTHWTPWGAQVAAQSIARMVGKYHADLVGDQAYTSLAQPEVSHSGDLLTYIPLGDWFASFGPQPEILVPVRTETLESNSDAAPDLFGDEPDIAVALVGTSYSANKTWNFPGFLREALATDLYDYSKEGKGPFEPMADYLASEEFREQTPRLIIWELPERFLPVAYADDIYQFAQHSL